MHSTAEVVRRLTLLHVSGNKIKTAHKGGSQWDDQLERTSLALGSHLPAQVTPEANGFGTGGGWDDPKRETCSNFCFDFLFPNSVQIELRQSTVLSLQPTMRWPPPTRCSAAISAHSSEPPTAPARRLVYVWLWQVAVVICGPTSHPIPLVWANSGFISGKSNSFSCTALLSPPPIFMPIFCPIRSPPFFRQVAP